MEKELEKLKRTEDTIKAKKHIALKGDRSILEETEEDRDWARDRAIWDDMEKQGNTVIAADQKRVQVLRHRVGQLDSVEAVPFEELEAMRLATAEKLKVLEEAYWNKREAEGTWKRKKTYGETSDQLEGAGDRGGTVTSPKNEAGTRGARDRGSLKNSRKRSRQSGSKKDDIYDESYKESEKGKSYGQRGQVLKYSKDETMDSEKRRSRKDSSKKLRDSGFDKSGSRTPGILKKSQSSGDQVKPMFDYRNLKKQKSPDYGDGGSPSKSKHADTEKRQPARKSKYDDEDSASDDGKAQDSAPAAARTGRRSRSLKKKKSPSPLYADPRQEIYEAKFETFLANKKRNKELAHRKRSTKAEEWDIWTKGPASPSKLTRRFKAVVDPVAP